MLRTCCCCRGELGDRRVRKRSCRAPWGRLPAAAPLAMPLCRPACTILIKAFRFNIWGACCCCTCCGCCCCCCCCCCGEGCIATIPGWAIIAGLCWVGIPCPGHCCCWSGGFILGCCRCICGGIWPCTTACWGCCCCMGPAPTIIPWDPCCCSICTLFADVCACEAIPCGPTMPTPGWATPICPCGCWWCCGIMPACVACLCSIWTCAIFRCASATCWIFMAISTAAGGGPEGCCCWDIGAVPGLLESWGGVAGPRLGLPCDCGFGEWPVEWGPYWLCGCCPTGCWGTICCCGEVIITPAPGICWNWWWTGCWGGCWGAPGGTPPTPGWGRDIRLGVSCVGVWGLQVAYRPK